MKFKVWLRFNEDDFIVIVIENEDIYKGKPKRK